MSAQHTPGPFYVNGADVFDKEGRCVGMFDTGYGGKVARANASLFGAAPDLLAALSFYADIADYRAPLTGGTGKLWLDCGAVARAAIAKATGAA